MGHQIIKQPNGLYAVWSSVVDAIVMYDADRQEMIDFWADNEHERLTNSVNQKCDALDRGENVYAQFQMTWEEALTEHEKRHGKLEAAPSTEEKEKEDA